MSTPVGGEPGQDALAAELRRIGAEAGLDAMGITTAEPFTETRTVLETRRAAGLAGGMQFTYRNPALSTEPERTMPGARSIVVGARRYLRTRRQDAADAATGARSPDGSSGHPPASSQVVRPEARVARFAWSDHYAALRGGLGPVADLLRAHGHRAMVLVDDNRMVDRAAAARAGLGWYGKNSTLLLPGAGSWYVLGSVLTDAVLPPDRAAADGCGTCDRCRPACPTGALVAPGVLDGRRCLAWLVQAPGVFPRRYREAVGDRIYGCDDCQDACPVNRAATRRDPPVPAATDATPTVDVLDLLASTDAEILARWGRWYIAERAPRWLRRNALIVLGNTGDPGDGAVVDAVLRALGDADPMVRAHAVWAAARLGRTDLLGGLAGEREPAVRAELDAVATVRPRSRPAVVDVGTGPTEPDLPPAVDPRTP